jgi:hypothetical protein
LKKLARNFPALPKFSKSCKKSIAHFRRSDYKLDSTLTILNTIQNNRQRGDTHWEHSTVDRIVLETMAIPHGT